MRQQEHTEVSPKRIAVRRKEEQLFVHIVWRTWNDAPLLAHADVRQAAHRTAAAKAREHRCRVLAVGGTEDHVHILLRFPGSSPVSMLAREIRETSAHAVSRARDLIGHARADTVWSAAFGLRTVGIGEIEDATTYVEHQPERHRSGEIWPDWETVESEREIGLRPALDYFVRDCHSPYLSDARPPAG